MNAPQPIIHTLTTRRRLVDHFEFWPNYTMAIVYFFIDDTVEIITATLSPDGDSAGLVMAPSIHAELVRQYRDLLEQNACDHLEQLKCTDIN